MHVTLLQTSSGRNNLLVQDGKLVQYQSIISDYYFLIFLICCLGHALIWVRALNWMHGIRSQAIWTDAIRLSMHVILSGLPFLWFLYAGFHAPEPFWESWPSPLSWMLVAYFWLIFFLGLLLFPLVWINYLLRRAPVSNRLLSIDVQQVGKALGRLPVGTGRRGWKAHLPGNQAFDVELVEREFKLSRLPAALEGLRILHISDLHFCGRPDRAYFERVFYLCSQRPFDLLIVTGDLVDSSKHYHWLQLFHLLKPALGKYAILGNHDLRFDTYRIQKGMKDQGFTMMDGVADLISIRDVPVLLAGNVAPWLLPVPDLTGFPVDETFRLAIIHAPDQFKWAVENQFDLVLAGHNHGGQIRVPGFGSIFVPSKTGRRYDGGVFQDGKTLLHVSRGLSGGHPVRYFCRPEATWLTLRRA